MLPELMKFRGSQIGGEIGTWVASATGAASFIRLIVSEKPLLFSAMGFDIAPYAGLVSIVTLFIVNTLQSQSWKAKYEREVESANQLRRNLDDTRKDKEDLINHVRWQRSKIEELGHHCAWQKRRITELMKLNDDGGPNYDAPQS